jgi:hypothetical protein
MISDSTNVVQQYIFMVNGHFKCTTNFICSTSSHTLTQHSTQAKLKTPPPPAPPAPQEKLQGFLARFWSKVLEQGFGTTYDTVPGRLTRTRFFGEAEKPGKGECRCRVWGVLGPCPVVPSSLIYL